MNRSVGNWNLDSFFLKDNNYDEFQQFLNEIESKLLLYCNKLDFLSSLKDVTSLDIHSLFKELQDISGSLGIADGFLVCLQTIDANSSNKKFKTTVSKLISTYLSASSFIDYYLAQIPSEKWEIIVSDNLIKPISFPLEKRRLNSKKFNAPSEIKIINSLKTNGLHSWEELHSSLLNKINLEIQQKLKQYFKNNKTMNNEKIRNIELKIKTELLYENQDLFASIINNISGFRLNMDEILKRDSFLSEALFDINNMSENSLWKMWEIIELNKDKLLKYFKIKAKIMNKEKIEWEELTSPIIKKIKKIPEKESIDFIIIALSSFSPNLKEFLQTFVQENWLKNENDATKKRVAFCLNFAQKKQSRVYINIPNDLSFITTLAHEIGHAYHYHVMHDLPILSQNYSLSIAETVSTLAELIVTDKIIDEQTDINQKLSYMNLKLENNIVFLLDIYSRFIFEYELYKNRQVGILESKKLNEIMEYSRKKAFGNMLESYNITSWCSTQHFYKTNVPFYNFPYAFGCLFSNFLLNKSKQNNKYFINNFDQLLKDTGSMTLENLMLKHFNIDLQESQFWQESIDCIIKDIEKFEETLNMCKT